MASIAWRITCVIGGLEAVRLEIGFLHVCLLVYALVALHNSFSLVTLEDPDGAK